MEFWGVEVKPGETVKCGPGENRYLHLSQASLGETKKDKGSENVPIFVKFDDQKLVLGTLSGDKCAQIQYDLVFEKELELSHSSKNASVYFCGYKTAIDEHDHDGYSDFDSDEEEFQLAQAANGKASLAELGKAKVAKADGSSDKLKAKAKAVQALKDDKPKVDEDEDDDDDDDEDDDSDEEEDSDEDSDGLEIDDEDDSDGEEDDSEEEEETPKKVEVGKKRGAASGPKTPVPEKKAKLVSPAGGQKTGGDSKKSEHTATPHPAKKVGKKTTSANDGKSKQQSPKSGGSVTCESCSKTFNSDNALQAHSKAKHSAAK